MFVESYSLLNSSFVLFDILFHLADFVVVPVPFENILQFCDPLGGGFSFHPDVSVFQFGVAHVADAVVQPMGFYSNKIKSLDAIKEGTTISIPNDPTNGGRALLLIQAAGLIKLKAGVTGNTATPADIVENPRGIKIVELEAAQLPRSLDDVEIAAIPMNYVISAGLSPAKQGFYFESREAPFALMIIASRADNAKDEKVQKFVKAYQSPEVKAFIEKTFNGAVKAAW